MEELYALPVDPDVPPRPALVVNHLVLEDLPEGQISRVFVELVGDGLATGIRVPVLVMRGTQPGPVFGITAALHGNELNGIPVIHEVFRRLDPAQLKGTVVGVVVANVPGLHRFQREFNEGTDLNRIMPGREGGTEPQVYARRLLDRIIKPFEFLVDLHTASFGRVNSLYVRANLLDETTAAMAYLQRPQIVVHNEGADTTLRGAASELGAKAITVEIGDPQTWQDRYTFAATEGVWRILASAGLVDGAGDDDEEVPEPIICRASHWLYTDRGGLLKVFPEVTDLVKEGDLIAEVRDAFGEVIRRYRAPHDGVVVGRSVNPVGQTGARILHLGHVAPEGHAFITAGRAVSSLRS